MTRYVRMFLSAVVLASLCAVLMGAPSDAAEIFFEDDFNGSSIDSLKWNTDIATSGYRICTPDRWQHPDVWYWQDVSVEPCYGYTQPVPYGYIAVNNGEAEFYSGVQTTFPFIWVGPPTRPSPFPATGDFVFETRMKYKQPLTYYIAGLTIARMENLDPVNKTRHAGEGVFYIWGYSAGLYAPAVTIPITDSNYHVYRLEYTDGRYSVYVDNELKLGPAPNTVRPNTILLGISVITDAGPNNWSDFTVDYVRVTVLNLSCVQPLAGMVGWWPGDGNAKDLIGSNHGELVNGAAFVDGKVGKAFSFGSTDADGVKIQNSTSLQLQTFTIDTWIKRARTDVAGRGPSSEGLIFGYGSRGYGLGLWPDGRLFLTKVDESEVSSSVLKIVDTNVHHVAVTKSGSAVKFYVDGVEEVVPAYDPGFSFTTGVAIGNRGDLLEPSFIRDTFIGVIDEIEIFNRPLTLMEIQAIYLAGSAGKCKPENHPPVANAGPDQTREMTSCAGASVTLDGSGSSDPDGDALIYTWTENGSVIATGISPTVTLSYGSHSITLTVDDGKGGTDSDEVVINIIDTTAPTLNVTLSPNILWPPNHKYVKVTPSITVTDACADAVTVQLLNASSSEPDNGLGDGDTANDIVINSDGTISLRAERPGKGTGRVYTISYLATDIGGNTTTSSVTVTVPHDMR